jgi:Flp pilus assembly protein TadD
MDVAMEGLQENAMTKSLTPGALKLHLLLSLVPLLAAVALAAYQELQVSRSSAPTLPDMHEAAGAPSEPHSLTSSSFVYPAPVSPEEAAFLEGAAQALALPHEHLGRVNHLARAQTLRELGDPAGALTESRRALYDAPEEIEPLRIIARLGQLTGQTEQAVHALEQLGRMNPEDASPLVQQARLLLSLGRSAEAISVGEEALSRDPEDPEAYQVLGRAQLATGNLSEAILRFQQAVHLAPEHGHALNNLGLAWLRSNENARAAEALARAAALLPHVAYVHNNLGVAYERLGRTEEAQAAYSAATRLSPRYIKAQVNSNRMNRVASLGASLGPDGSR